MLWKRIVTTLLLVPLVFIIVRSGERQLFILLLILAGLALREFYSFFQGLILSRFLPGFFLAALFIQSGVRTPQEIYPLVTILLLALFLYYLLFYPGDDFLLHLGITLAGSFYVGWLLRYPILLLKQGIFVLFLALFITWGNDIGAYLVGSRWGQHPLAPDLSPKKSVEGALGGLAGAVFFALVGGYFLGLAPYGSILLGLAGALAAQLGDLFESKMKRVFGIKDSGAILPGHGGILDRIDSLLFSLPVIYYLLPLIC